MCNGALLLIAVYAIGAEARDIGILGGYNTVNPYSDPKYYEMAMFALREQPQSVDGTYVTVLRLTDVQVQQVSGTNYKVAFETALTDCVNSYIPNECWRVNKQPQQGCTAVIFEDLEAENWELTSLECYRIAGNDESYVDRY
ncbi:salivary cystatin-L2-like [Amblyomma americanum]